MRKLLWIVPLLGGLLGCQLAGRKPIGEVLLQLDLPSRGPGFSNALYQTVGVGLSPGHEVVWQNNGSVFDSMELEMSKATKTIHVVTFIWSIGETSGRLLRAIAAAHNRGVQCRVLVDSVGSLSLDDAPIRAAGCEVRWFRPVPGQDDLARDHRKLLIIDGKVGFTGGFGIDDKWLGQAHDEEHWRDSNVRVRGPAVREMQQAFAENWLEAGGSLLPLDAFPKDDEAGPARAALVTSSSSTVSTHGDRLMQLLVAAAHHRLWISNAYFVPSEPLLELLGRRAKDGLDVRVLSAGDKTDTRQYLPEQRARIARLLAHGVRAFEFQPTMMHAKTVLVDDDVVAVGSLNLDALSLNKMEEASLIVQDKEVAASLATQYESDMKRSLEVKLPADGRKVQ